jgi:hypothetical protein
MEKILDFRGHLARNKSLDHQYTSLYNIVQIKGVSIASVLNQNPLIISFCRTLGHNRVSLWLQLVQRLLQIQLNDKKVIFVSGLTSSDIFCVKSMYLDLLDDDTKYLKKYFC